MSEEDIPPLPSHAMLKFQRQEKPCESGDPCLDSTHLLQTGEPCCSLCRRVIIVKEGVWVHT